MVFIKILCNQDDLPERQEEYYVTVAKRDLRRKFRANVDDSLLAVVYHCDFEVIDWPDLHGDLLALSKMHPYIDFCNTKIEKSSISNGAYLINTGEK